VRYRKAPILEAVLEFRWSDAKLLEDLQNALKLQVFRAFEEPKPRRLINAMIDVENGNVSQDVHQVGFDVALKDGTERVFLEQNKFVFVQSAPYDRWDHFAARALELLVPTVDTLGVSDFDRVGARFVNRIDIPFSEVGNFNTDDYITLRFDGPRQDKGIIEEFQMRIVKPTEKEGISYTLVAATSPSPLAGHGGIVLDIDVFTQGSVPASGLTLASVLATMRDEKNDIFERCITDRARDLFGGPMQ
jgi:uncharacterized protein (TIGR04255 family)